MEAIENKDLRSTIMIVDDDEVYREIFKDILRSQNYLTIEASNGEQAIDFAKKYHIDLALLDIHLPGISGIEVAKLIDPVPYIYFTQESNKDIVNTALSDKERLRAVGYLVKPLNLDSIIPTISSALLVAGYINKNRNLLLSVAEGIEKEKKQIAINLHDAVCQELTEIKTSEIALANADSLEGIKKHSMDIVESVSRIKGSVVNIIEDLYPQDLDTLNSVNSLKNIVERCQRVNKNCRYTFECSVDIENIDSCLSKNIYRTIQESLTNISKHSSASEVSILVYREQDNLSVIIKDNGKGFDIKAVERGHGLSTINDRISAVGGKLDIRSGDFGTVIKARIPSACV